MNAWQKLINEDRQARFTHEQNRADAHDGVNHSTEGTDKEQRNR